MFHSNMEEIKGRFACLLKEVQLTLEANHVEIDHVRKVLLGMFCCRNDCLPDTSLKDIFNAVSERNFWNYEHHSPVETLIRNLIPDHRSMMTPYKEKLTGFYATTKLIEYIQNSSRLQ